MNKSKYKFVFANGDVGIREANNIQDAAILACASRISNKKTTQITSVFAQDPADSKSFKLVNQPCVTINLKS